MSCKIDKDISFDCDALAQGGVENRVIAINFEDWQNATITEDGSSEEITDISLASGIEGYEFQTPKGGGNVIPNTPLRTTTGVDGYTHQVDVRVNTLEQLDRKNISRIRHNKVVLIVPLLEGRALVYGSGVGLRLSDFQEMPGDADTGATIQFIASTPETDPPEAKAGRLVAAAFDLDTLLAPAA